MLKTTKKFIEEVDELKGFMIKELGKEMLEDIDDNGLLALTKCFKLLNTSEEIMLRQAEMLESMNNKLDRLLNERES